MLKNILLVGLGGACGSMLRYVATLIIDALQWASWTATLSVNAIGSFLIGLCIASCADSDWKLMLTVGFCGGFTTFSTFSSQTMEMLRLGHAGSAFLYIAGTLILCLLAVWLGMRR